MTLDDQLALPTLDIPKQRAPKVQTAAPGDVGGRWSIYRPKKPARCDDCVALLAVDVSAPRARQARFKLTTARGDTLTCASHMEDRRIAECKPPIKEKRP